MVADHDDSSIINDRGLTFAEKILSLKSMSNSGPGRNAAAAGDFVISSVDFTYVHDVQGPLVIKIFEELKGEKVFDRNKVLLNIDHDFPPSSERSAELHNRMRNFASSQDCMIQEGSNCHQYILENFATPGMLIIGADSHTTTLGSLGTFAAGMGSSDVASILLTGKTWLRVPETIRIHVDSPLGPGITAKDVALEALRVLGTDGANYKSIEWVGKGVEAMTIDSRSTLTNLALEMGAKNSVVFSDGVTRKFLRGRNREPGMEIRAGDESPVFRDIYIESESLVPMVALPGSPGNAKPVSEIGARIPINAVLVGTCTNGRLEDLRRVAAILKGRHVKQGVRMIVTPNSIEVYKQADREGIISTLLESGATVTSPGCGACAGLSKGLIGRNEVAVFAGPRNFPGRLGSVDSKIYLSSPETAAASAITGFVSSIEEVDHK